MKLTPTYICPHCNKRMVIMGTKCPYCEFNFTREMVDKFIFSCPNCCSDKIKIDMKNETGAGTGITVQKAAYSAVFDIAQGAVNSGLSMSFECKSCGHMFDSSSFLLQDRSQIEVQPDFSQPITPNKTKNKGCLSLFLVLFGIAVVLFVNILY